MSNIKQYISGYIKDDNKFKLIVFSIVCFPGLIQWIIVILNFLGINNYLQGRHFFVDFNIYYNAVNLYLNGEDFYNNTGFYYPPISILFFLPFGFLPLVYSHAAFFLFNLILLFLTTIVVLNIIKHYGVYTSTTEKILLLISIYSFEPINKALMSGNINELILFILTVSYYYIFVKKEKTLSSVFLTIGTAIKIYPMFLLILEVFNKNAKGLISKYLSFMILVTSVSIIFFGIKTHLRFVDSLVNFEKVTLYNASDILLRQQANNYNASITDIVMKLLSLFEPSQKFFDEFNIFWSILKIIFLITILYYVYTISLNKHLHDLPEWEILIYSTLLILPIIISNFVWTYYGSFLTTAYILFIFVFELDLIQRHLLFLALTLHSAQHYIVLLSNIIGWPFTSFVYIVSPIAISFILFLFLLLYSFRKIKVRTTIPP
jgi:hypothetical protein